MRVPGFLLRDRVVIETFQGSGAHGNRYAVGTTVKAHVESTHRLVTDAQGRNLVASAAVVLRPEVGHVPVESRLTWDGRTYRVLQSSAWPSAARPTHRELLLGSIAG